MYAAEFSLSDDGDSELSADELRLHMSALPARVMLELLLGAGWSEYLAEDELLDLLDAGLERRHYPISHDEFMLTIYKCGFVARLFRI